MAVTSGFFNSKNGDRKYDANQMGSLFGGIITDGIFANYPQTGDQLVVSAVEDMKIKVGPGRGWFHNTWIDNDDDLVFTCSASSPTYTRIDSVFIKVDKRNANRRNTIVLQTGAASSNPVHPTPAEATDLYWYRLADISIPAQATTVGTITSYVGTELPIITAPLDHVSAQGVINGWKDEVDQLVQSTLDNYVEDPESTFTDVVTDVALKIPAIWFTDLDIPTVRGNVMQFTTPNWEGKWISSLTSTSTVPPPHLFPDIPVHIQNRSVEPPEKIPLTPKRFDIILGKNGYYGEIMTVSTETYEQEDEPTRIRSYTITVASSGFYIAGISESLRNIIHVEFQYNCGTLNSPEDLESWQNFYEVTCNTDFESVKRAAASGKTVLAIVRFRNRPLLREHSERTEIPYYTQLLLEYTGPYSVSMTSTDALIFRSPIIETYRNDAYFRIYWLDGQQPKITVIYTNSIDKYLRDVTPVNATFNTFTGSIVFEKIDGGTAFTVRLPIYTGTTSDDDPSPI